MAGRGRAATLPAWMTAGGAATAAAPGAPAATGPPAAAVAGGPAAPGSTGVANAAIMQAQAIAASLVAQQNPAAAGAPAATSSQPQSAPLGITRAPMVIPSATTPGVQALSPTGALPPAVTGAGAPGQPNAAAVAAAIAAAQAAAAAAGVGGAAAAPAAAAAGGAGAAAAPVGLGSAAGAAAPSPLYSTRPPAMHGLGPAAGPPPMAVPPYGVAPPGAYPPGSGVPPMFRPPMGMPGFPPGMLPPPGFPGAPPGMPGFPGQPMGGYPAPNLQPPAAAAAAPQHHQQQQPKSSWSEHSAPDGRKYYYNSDTRQSVWVKPEELMTPEERAKAAVDKAATAAPAAAAPAAAGGTAASQQAAVTSSPAGAAAGAAASGGGADVSEKAKAWKQYTAPDGRPYYYNKLTRESKWTMPEEMKAAQAAAAAEKAGAGSSQPTAVKPVQSVPLAATNGDVSRPAAADKANEEPKPAAAAKPEPVKQEPVKYATKEAAKEAFKQLLADFEIPPEASWDNAMRLIIHDVRYGALKQMGEKKSAFNEYCTARRAAEREEARRKQVAAKEAFMALLEDTPEIEPGDSYDRAQRLLNHDGRWKDVESDALRRELFKDHMEGLKRRKAEEAKRKQEAAVAAFKELLQRSHLKPTSSWRKVSAKLEDDEAFQALDRLARLEVFQAHIRQLEEEEKQEKEREKEARRRKERKNRDAFRVLLQRHRDEGTINVHTRWKEYQPLVEDSEEYLAVKKNASGSRPRELFEDLILELEEEYEKARPLLKDALRSAGWSATPDSTYTDYCEVLQAQAAAAAEGEDGDKKLASIRDSHKRSYFEQEVGRAKEKAAESDKKKKRAVEKFEAFVRSAEGLYSNTTWEEFEDAFKKEDEFIAVGPEVAKRVFGEHIEKLQTKEKDKKRDRDGDEDGGSKKKKRSSRHDDDDHKKSKRHRRDRSRDKSRERSSRGHSRDHRKRSPESGEPEEGEV